MAARPSGLHHTPKCTMLAQAMAEKPIQFEVIDARGGAKVARKPQLEIQSGLLFGMDRGALAALMAGMGEPAWRGRQLAEAMYSQRIVGLEEISTLPLA